MTDAADLHDVSLRELLDHHVAVQQEFRRRGLIRTNGSLAGELGERIAQAAYGGSVAVPVTRGLDLVDEAGRSVQVKTRALAPAVRRKFQFGNFDFDVVLFLLIDVNDYSIAWARETTRTEAESLAVANGAKFDVTQGKAASSGLDVTDRMRAAYADLA